MSNLASEIISEKESSFNNLSTKREMWDKSEQLFHGQLNDAQSETAKSKVFDPRLSTLVMERSFRVMAQLAVGKVKGISKNDLGDEKLKNLLLQKYVIPNANAQFDFLTKMRMVDMYSNVYGSFYTLQDWDVKANGYVGPDTWMLNIRDVFPQNGSISLNDSDQIVVRTWRPLSYFKGLAKRDGFRNLPSIIAKLSDKAGSKQSRDADAISKREDNEYPDSDVQKGLGYFEVLTRFERDRWVDVCVDADEVFRDIKNPHDDGELPVEVKYSIPLLDDFFGFSDMERGGGIQQVINSIWNLYLDGVKMSMFPPTLINKDNIASMSSIKWGAAKKWLVRGNINNAAQPINLTPQGISTFNNTLQASNASLLNLFGTSDTTVTKETDAGYGKTPQALQMQQARENTRDNADRFFMEQYYSRLMRKFCNLLSKKQTQAIQFRMFPDEIDQIKREYPEIEQLYDQNTGKLSVKKSGKSSLYDYEIVSGSTYALDQKSQQENLSQLMSLYQNSQSPQGNVLVRDLDQSGYKLNFGELFKRIVSSSGIQDWDKILIEKTEEEKSESILEEDQAKFMNVMQQMGGMGAIPPMPQQPQQQPEPTMTNQTML